MRENLIKRSDAIATIEKRKAKIVSNCESDKWFRKMISEVEAIPSADLNAEFSEWAKLWFKKELEADRPQGKWIIKQKGFGIEAKICSVCGAEKNNMSNFCPNCGADMREREGE